MTSAFQQRLGGVQLDRKVANLCYGEKVLIAMVLAAVDPRTRVLPDKGDGIRYPAPGNAGIDSDQTEFTPEHLAASCAVPLVLPQKRIEGRWFSDGGLLNPLPVWAAVDLGATEIVALMVGRRRRADPLAPLTARERQVLSLMAEGKSNLGIAEALGVTQTAVEKHVGRIFGKLALDAEPLEHRRVLAVLTLLRAG